MVKLYNNMNWKVQRHGWCIRPAQDWCWDGFVNKTSAYCKDFDRSKDWKIYLLDCKVYYKSNDKAFPKTSLIFVDCPKSFLLSTGLISNVVLNFFVYTFCLAKKGCWKCLYIIFKIDKQVTFQFNLANYLSFTINHGLNDLY